MPTKARNSGNPAVRASAEVSSVANFKKKKGGLFTMPSGEVMRLRNPGGLAIFRSEGTIPNGLMTIVNKAIDKGVAPSEEEILGENGLDPKMVDEMMALVDLCAMRTIVEPEVHFAPKTEAERDDDLLYVDELDDEDKMFIFQWVTGGTADVEQFRQESSKSLASLQRRTAVAQPAKRASRARKK